MLKTEIYAEIPTFDQQTQAIYQLEPVDMGDHIFYGVEVKELPVDDDVDVDGMEIMGE